MGKVRGHHHLPSGVVAFLLTDVEGSTRLWDRDAATMADALARHDTLIDESVDAAGGILLKERGEGDSTFSVFDRPTQAVAAALDARRRLEAEAWPDGCRLEVRFAIHMGEVTERDGDYFGTAVNRAARIRSIAIGGQILVSEAVAAVVADHLPEAAVFVALGEQQLRGLERPERISAVVDTRRPHREAIGGVVPYRGLLAFQPEDHDFFFGRERLVASLLNRVSEQRLLVVVGASGSGKSSLVRAGLVASLQQGALPGSKGWPVRVLTPGSDPVRALVEAGGVDGHAGTVVLVIDQMEELFTSCRSAPARATFVDRVLDAVDNASERVLVLGALRADFYGHCASIPRFADALSASTALLAPMDDEELRRAIEGPAEIAGLRFDAGLVDLILRDLAHEPGSLPLLSHALLETWRRREGRELTVAGYNDSGGVRGAIAHTADTVWNELDDSQCVTARRILLRLTELGEGTEDTRRRIERSELDSVGDEGDVDTVVRILAGARLLTVDENTIEVAHEALIREWPRLREWLDEDREVIRVHRHLTRAAQDWSNLDHDPGELYRGPRLAAARDLLDDDERVQLNDLEQSFVEASVAAEDEELAARERANRRLRVLLAGTAVGLVVAIVAGVLAYRQRDRAHQQAKNARAATVSAEVDRIVAEIPKLLRSDRELAGLLAVQAHNLRPDPATEGALLATLFDEPRLQRTGFGGSAQSWALGAFPDGRHLAVSGNEKVDVWDVASGRIVATRRAPGSMALDVAPDGKLVALGSNDGTLRFLDSALREVGAPLHFEAPIAYLAFSPDGSSLAVAIGPPGTTSPSSAANMPRLIDVVSRQTTLLMGHSRSASAIAFGDRYVATAGNDGTILLHDVNTGMPTGLRLDFKGFVRALAFSPDGRFLAATTASQGRGEDGVAAFRLPTGAPVPRLTGQQGTVYARFSPDSSQLLVTDGAGNLQRWDTTTWGEIGKPIPMQHGPAQVTPMSNGVIVTAAYEGTISVWSTGETPPIARRIPGSRAGGGFFNREGTEIATAGNDDQVNLHRTGDEGILATLSVRGVRPRQLGPTPVAFSPSGGLVAIASSTGEVQLFDARTRERLGDPLKVSSHPLNGALFSPDSQLLLTWSGDDPDQGAYAIAVASRAPVRIDPAAPHVVQASFSPDGSRLVIAAVGTHVFAYPVHRGRIGRGRDLGLSNVGEAVFSPDGHALALGSLEETVQLVDSRSLRRLGDPFNTGSGLVVQAMFSPDGRYLAAEDFNTHSIWLYDLRAHAQVGDPIPGSDEGLGWFSFSPDSRSLVLPHAGGSILLSLDPNRWAAAACERAGRDLTKREWDHYLSAAGEYHPTCSTSSN